MEELIALSERTITIGRNEFLRKSGTPDTNAYYVESGSLRLFVMDGQEERVVRFGYKGSMIASLDSYLTGRPSCFYIQAIKKSTVRVISKVRIDTFLQEAHNHLLWKNILENLVVQQIDREIDVLTSSPRERYQRVLERSPQLFQEIPLRHIANYLRMSPETLSRLKKS